METKKLIATCPEYENKNRFIRKMFWDRIHTAIDFIGVSSKSNKRRIILDVGCGRAKLFETLNKRRHSFKFYGIDINEDIYKLKISHTTFKVIKGTEKKYPLKKDSIDIVFALDCLEHIKNLNLEISKIRIVLKNGGLLIISGPTESIFYKLGRLISKGTWKEVYESGEEHSWNIYEIKKKIISRGFILERTRKIRFTIFPLFLVYRFKKVR